MAAFTRIYPNEPCASLPRFLLVWKKERSLIKAWKEPLFMMCGEYELLRESLRVAATQETLRGSPFLL